MLNKAFTRLTYVATVLAVIVLVSFAEPTPIDATTVSFWVPKSPPVAHYKIDCSIDPAKGLLEGTEVICFRNTTTRPIRLLTILWLSDNERMLEITSKGKPVSILAETAEGDKYIQTLVQLPNSVYPDDQVNLEIAFNGIKFSQSVSNREGFHHCVGWHPVLWWGFDTHSSFDVLIKAPREYRIITSGKFDKKTGSYHAEGVRSFGLLLTKEFNVIEANAGDVLVSCVFPPKSEKLAHLLLSTAVDVIDFYRERFGFYPFNSLTIVPGASYPTTGGCRVATNIVAIHAMEQMDKRPESHWQWITAHEIGHQYWGEYVIEKDKPAWLWIGLGIYADREYTRTRGFAPGKHRGMMVGYIKGVRKGLDTTINRSQEELNQIKFNFNNVVIHGKGYSVISALDCVLGETVFDRIYRRCLKEFGGRRLGVHEFRAVCEEESNQDLGWFFDQWVNSNRYLSYEISSSKCEKKGDGYISEVEVKCLGDLKMPVPVTAYFEDGTSQTKFTDRLLDTNILVFESKAPLKEVRLDPEGMLALVVPPPSLGETQLNNKIQEMPWTGAGKRAFNVFNKAKESKLSNAKSWFKLGLTLYDGKYYPQALEAFQTMYELSEKGSYRIFASLVWQGHILDLLGRRDEAVALYKEALKKDKNFEGRYDQYGIIINQQWVEERLKNPFQRK